MSFSSVLLIALYIACEMIANTTAGKPVALPGGITVPAAVFIYALTFTLIDLVNERFGKQGARYVVYSAFIANLLLAGYMSFAVWLPAPAASGGAYHSLPDIFHSGGLSHALGLALPHKSRSLM